MTLFEAMSTFVPVLGGLFAVILLVFGLVVLEMRTVVVVGIAGIVLTFAMTVLSIIMGAGLQALAYFLATSVFVAATFHLLLYIARREDRVPDSAVVPNYSNGGPGTE
jgi:hypothetical protein